MPPVSKCFVMTTALATFAGAAAMAQDVYPIGADQLAFSIHNMDPSVDPGDDFQQYAAGGWLDRADRPERMASIGAMAYMTERANTILKAAVVDAAANAAAAPKGSPVQQVGDFFNAFMDIEARDAAGLDPLRPYLDQVNALETHDDIARFLGEWSLVVFETPLMTISVTTDMNDATKISMAATEGSLGLSLGSVYQMPGESAAKQAYRQYVEDLLILTGVTGDEAGPMSEMIVSLETILQSGELSPVEYADPRNRNNPTDWADFQALVPEMDMSLYLEGQGQPVPDMIILFQPNYYPKLSQVLQEYSMEDLRDYLRFSVVSSMQGVLGPDFKEPVRALTEALLGVATQTPDDDLALQMMPGKLGHPLGRLFVEAAFPEDTRAATADMIERIMTQFRQRIETRHWLSEETREAALGKLDAFYIGVGYPDEWIDYSSVEVVPDDPVANLVNLATFGNRRDLSKFGHPKVHEPFNNPHGTLPMLVNAGYTPSINGFEVTAGIAQPAGFDPEMDAAVNYCRLGAIIGHEMTHGFDSGGRLYDAQGNLRNWWTDADAQAFEAEAQKLIDQADAYEFLPGNFVNGALTVKENMADIGGITFAHLALMKYLEEHPEENVEIDGLTPSQRCFISWAQFWTEKSTPQYMENSLTNVHAPNPYRTTAPLRHVEAFYEAFDITEDDPMWLPPEQRVNAW
ncbi:M13 family metallopeptidase [Chachezhania antarctica]|uniref:M13 family metallopeptidase n=1 Tax=Chachezhania antarctica TaxID=2340860 RepID=UPI000EB20169|nr:M13 family metallopeptidase [Chachezhania antarctica]|tara:strand:+ start:10879 stop:12945 length:2067 start_codon:yes stop_codon:yes gene_type:complete